MDKFKKMKNYVFAMSGNFLMCVSCRRSWRAPLSAFCVRDGDPLGRRLRHGGSVAGAGRDGVPCESPSRAALQYSPTRRDDFVRNVRSAGARPEGAFDPVLAMWASPDPAGQYMDPYGFGGDPINGVDREGRWFLSAVKMALGVTEVVNLASAAKAASTADSFKEGAWTFVLDYNVNSVADQTAGGAAGVSSVWGTIGSIGAAGQWAFGDGDAYSIYKPLAVSVWSPFVSDYNSVNNAYMAGSRGAYGEILTNLSASGTNSMATDYFAVQYTANQGFGSQQYTYEGSYEGSMGHRNIIWGQRTNNSSTGSAMNFGQNIVLYQGYYGSNSDDKQSTLVHEFVHGMQQSKYGTGGAIVRKKFRSVSKPSIDDSNCGEFGFSCDDVRTAFTTYSNDGSLDLMELEAEMEENAGEDSEYWFDAPVFY